MNGHPLKVGKLLEVSNGEWAIVCVSLTLFLAYHLIKVGRSRRIGWRRWLWNLPLSMQLAVGILIVCIGVGSRSTLIWAGRAANGGASAGLNEWALLWGSVVAIIGFMCILRVVTKPMLGHWPWIATLAAMSAYWLIWYMQN